MILQIIALLIWGSSFIAAKYAYTMLDPALMVQARLWIAGLLVLPLGLKFIPTIPKKSWPSLIFLSFINYVAVLLLQFIGAAYTSAASAVTIVGIEPLMMVFIGHFFFQDKAKLFHWFCGFSALLGIVLMVAGGAEQGGHINWLGCVLILLAGALFCFAIRPTQQLISQIGANAYTSLSLILGAILCLPFSLLLAQNLQIHWNTSGVISILYLGIACSWFAYWLWNKGMNRVPANLSGLLIALEPIFGVILAVIILNEHLSLLSWMGIVMVIGATLLATWLTSYDTQSQKENLHA